MEKTFIAYTAGFVDGEGCITLTQKSKLSGKNKRYYSICPKVVITNTNATILRLMQSTFGGYLAEHVISKTTMAKHYPQFQSKKPIYQLEFTHQKALQFIRRIYPYLQIKQRQARVLFQYEKTLVRGNNKTRATHHRQRLQLKNKIHT